MIATTALAILLAVVFLGAGASMVMAVDAQRANAAHLGYSVSAFRCIGAAATLGALGVLLGLAYPPVGLAAATGLVALMVGAIISHVRVRDRFHHLMPPIATGAAGIAYLILIGQQALS
ncbi:DoxX family protein [Nocardia beijingensis]|uniref:DoxX family protein n=1 Tax=Nocardia beijingensis TaxID=95162 RepID=UPI0033D378E7